MKYILTSLFMALFIYTPAQADWASGGGELLKDAKNPWFLQNTKKVDVCVIWKNDHFHAKGDSIGSLTERFEKAVKYWKHEFSKSFIVGGVVEVAGQEFNIKEQVILLGDSNLPPKSCMDADLKVQFGWLSEEQIELFETKLGGLKKYIGAAIRTDYDTVNMKGKGFIYLKADLGPLFFPSDLLAEKPWSLGEGYLIDQTLMHELGHVFGVGHKGFTSIMGESYMENIHRPAVAKHHANHLTSKGFFALNMTEGEILRDECYSGENGIRRGWKKFLNAPDQHNCVRVFFNAKGEIEFHSMNVLAYQMKWELRGTLKLEGKPTFSWDESVNIYLPKDQKVITRIPSGAGRHPYIVGPMIKIQELGGTYTGVEGLKRQVRINHNPVGLGFAESRFSVKIDDTWFWNLDFIY